MKHDDNCSRLLSLLCFVFHHTLSILFHILKIQIHIMDAIENSSIFTLLFSQSYSTVVMYSGLYLYIYIYIYIIGIHCFNLKSGVILGLSRNWTKKHNKTPKFTQNLSPFCVVDLTAVWEYSSCTAEGGGNVFWSPPQYIISLCCRQEQGVEPADPDSCPCINTLQLSDQRHYGLLMCYCSLYRITNQLGIRADIWLFLLD
jgi:hypothetical protein